jgi:integrase/recombinase XerD
MTAMAPHLTASLRQRLPVERAASLPTGATYAYAFPLLLHFAREQRFIPPAARPLEPLDAPWGRECLESLHRGRGHAPRTRTARLTAIKSFRHFVAQRVPSALAQRNRVLAMPHHKTDMRLVDHLTAAQGQASLDNPTPHTRLALRDRARLHVRVTAGVRVSEVVGLRLEDLSCASPDLHLPGRGKGRKNRRLPRWRPVAASVRAWLAVRGDAGGPERCLHARGKAMTRAGFASL